jgi:hypothetical protein
VKTVTPSSDIVEVKSLEGLEKVLKELQPGKSVTIMFEGKEIVLKAKNQ